VTDATFVNGSRPKTKAALKRTIAEYYEKPETEQTGLYSVVIESTSMFGGFDGSLALAEREGPKAFTVVGPSPYERKWYAQIKFVNGRWKVT